MASPRASIAPEGRRISKPPNAPWTWAECDDNVSLTRKLAGVTVPFLFTALAPLDLLGHDQNPKKKRPH